MKSSIAIFIFISASLHFFAINLYNNEESGSINHKYGDTVIDIIFQQQDNFPSTNKSVATPHNNKPPATKEAIHSIQKSDNKPVKEIATQDQPVKSVNKTEPLFVASNSFNYPKEKKPDIIKITSILNNELSKHFHYPKAAQRRNWQGEVLVEFKILANGTIENIHINKSSGYTILDNAAIKALEKINRYEQFAIALSGNNLEHILPVKYQILSAK
jgi:TonB family protein